MKGPTPICPSCGSAGVDHVDDELVCRRCSYVGTMRQFTVHITFGDDPDFIQAPIAERHTPYLSDEEPENV